MKPIWQQRPDDDNGDVQLLHNYCHDCGRKWTSYCAYWAVEHNSRNVICLGGVKFSNDPFDGGDFSEACMSRNVTTWIGARLPVEEARARLEAHPC